MTNDTPDIIRYFRVDRRQLVYLKFILEAYEGMSTLSTVDKSGPVVSLIVPVGFAHDMERLIAALQSEITLVELTAKDVTPHA
jgi:hypothetical protein